MKGSGCQSKQHKVPKVTANKPDEKAKCFVRTAVSWVTLSDQTGETGTCLLRLRVGETQRQMQMLPLRCNARPEGSTARAETIGNTPKVWRGVEERWAPAQQHGVLPLGTATIPPAGGTLQEGEAESWWVPSMIISVVELSSVLSVKATSLCLHCGECSLLCSAAEAHVLLLLEVMT